MEYSKILVEVDEVLNHLSAENLAKIPQEIRKDIAENKDKKYVWKYDETKKLKEQKIHREAIAFLSYLNMQYLLSEEQKKLMEEMHRNNEKMAEKEKAEKYQAKDLFQEENYKKQKFNSVPNEIIEYKESMFSRIIGKIKSFFK